MRGISQNVLDSVGYSELIPGHHKFPRISTYGECVGHTIYTPAKERKYDHTVYEAYKGNHYLYNEEVLPTLFYGKGVILVEGIFDCLSLVQAGLPCVAALTNSLSYRHLEKLKRYTDTVIFWHDSDTHGEQGYLRTCKKADEIGGLNITAYSNNNAKDSNDLMTNNPQSFVEATNILKEILSVPR